MVGANQTLNGSCDLTMPFQGWFAIHRLALTMINLSTKFEVYAGTVYAVVVCVRPSICHKLALYQNS